MIKMNVLNNISLSKKLALLVAIPIIFCLLIFSRYTILQYDELQDVASVSKRYEIFSKIEHLINRLSSEQKFINNITATDSLSQRQLDDLRQLRRASVTDYEHLVGYSSADIASRISLWPQEHYDYLLTEIGDNFNDWPIVNDPEALAQWGLLIVDLQKSLVSFIEDLPVDVDVTALRNGLTSYYYLLRLTLYAQQEQRLIEQYLIGEQFTEDQHNLFVELSLMQQFYLDRYLSAYATQEQSERLLTAFSKPAFAAGNDARVAVLSHSDELDRNQVMLADKRVSLIGEVTETVVDDIVTLADDIYHRQQIIFFSNIFVMIAMLTTMLMLGVFISRRTLFSVKEIGSTLALVEKTKDYAQRIKIPGRDEFARLAERLNILIDERKISENKLVQAVEIAEQSNKAKSLFLANISHEIKTPLNGIIGMSNILKSSNLPDSSKQQIEAISTSSRHLLDTLNNVLTLSKLESNSYILYQQEVFIDDVVWPIIEKNSLLAKAKDIRIDVDIQPDLVKKVIIDANSLELVIENILSNAIKFSHQCGRIFVKINSVISSDNSCVLDIVISDHGVGIAEENMSTIFHAFRQVDGSISRSYEGAGLGLGISKGIVELMSGSLALKSELSHGTTVTIKVECECKIPAPVIAPSVLRPLNILLLTDETIVANILRNLFSVYQLNLTIVMLDEIDVEDIPYTDYNLVMIKNTATDVCQSALQHGLSLLPDKPFMVLHQGLLEECQDQYKNLGLRFVEPYPIVPRMLMAALSTAVINNDLTARHRDQLPEQEPSGRVTASADCSEIKILLVEDNMINQQVAMIELEMCGFTVCLADDGREGVDAWLSEQPDIILMDCMMPVMDGIEATQEIRAIEAREQRKKTPIIALTATTLDADIQRCREVGMDCYIGKPFERESLVAAIHDLLAANK